jgi:uncharacterized protein YecE (DUF72 family)
MSPPVLRVGCPMWANRDWVGRYFPRDTPPGGELAHYARWCNAVEGNTTFYALPDEATVSRWAGEVPDDFRFAFKLPRRITHERRLRGAGADLTEFCDRLAPLHRHLAPCSVQLPASFGPEDLPVLDRFLAGLPSDWPFSVEVRHVAFGPGGRAERAVHDLLHGWGVDRVVLDSRALFARPPETPAEREAWERKPRLGVRPVATANRPVVRIIGRSDLAETRRHWAPWVTKVADWLTEGREPTVFLHTPDNRHSPELARRFWADVAEHRPQLAPLPVPPAPDPEDRDQLRLF